MGENYESFIRRLRNALLLRPRAPLALFLRSLRARCLLITAIYFLVWRRHLSAVGLSRGGPPNFRENLSEGKIRLYIVSVKT